MKALTREAQLQVDEVLLPLLEVSEESDAERLLAQIVSEHAEPVIKDIVRFKLNTSGPTGNHSRGFDSEDVCNDAILELLKRLKEFRADPQHKAIGNLRSYVAVIAYNTCYRHLRLAYPQRHILKTRLRYLLTHQRGFALWENDDKELVCGYEVWQTEKRAVDGKRARSVCVDPNLVSSSGLISSNLSQDNPADVLAAVLNYIASPLRFDDVVNIVAQLWGITDQTSSLDEAGEGAAELVDRRSDFTDDLDRREYLSSLWREIAALPLRQRAALLLNLKDAEGRGCIDLFHIAGVASIRQLATSLEMTAEEFAQLWNALPLDDLTIAGRLGLTRQQVINLRKSARARLARRMSCRDK
jgi:RNA polymerase sigma factor (sigma-70 family)